MAHNRKRSAAVSVPLFRQHLFHIGRILMILRRNAERGTVSQGLDQNTAGRE
jgi:hypothetical protein